MRSPSLCVAQFVMGRTPSLVYPTRAVPHRLAWSGLNAARTRILKSSTSFPPPTLRLRCSSPGHWVAGHKTPGAFVRIDHRQKKITSAGRQGDHDRPIHACFQIGADSPNSRQLRNWESSSKLGSRVKAGVLKDGEKVRFGFHNLRHSLASFLVRKGTDVKTVQKMLRHSDVSTTLGIYAHSVSEDRLNIFVS